LGTGAASFKRVLGGRRWSTREERTSYGRAERGRVWSPLKNLCLLNQKVKPSVIASITTVARRLNT